MLVILGARNFILFVIEKFDVQMFAKAICVYMEFFVAFVDFATEYAVGKRKIGPVEVSAFDFEMFMLVGRCAVVVAASGEECGKGNAHEGSHKGFDRFHFSLV